MVDRLDPDVLYARGFKAGSIVRLKMKNFLTYDECEVFTGPRLNIVIGPNGTGKSALTHAICLACCGSTSDVGRSNDLSKFVKHGSEGQESYAEVDILTAERTLVTVKRVINSENKGSKWFMDGRVAKQADVKAFIAALSIDVDNLCSFMPQDRVGAFSQFSPKEILSNTLRSIQAPDEQYNLFTEQQELSNIQDSKEDYRRRRDTKQMALDSSMRERDSMSAEMDRMQRRGEMRQQLEEYVIRLLEVEIKELGDVCEEKQTVVDEKTRRLQEEIRRVAPLEAAHRDLMRQQASRDKAAEDAKNFLRSLEDASRKKKDVLQQCEVDVDATGDDLILVATSRAKKEGERLRLAGELADLEKNEREILAMMPGILRNFDVAKAKVSTLSDEKAECEEEGRQLGTRCGQLRDDILDCKKDMAGLQDFKQVFKLKMSKHNDPAVRQALTVLDWLDANEERLRQTGALRGRIYGPVALHCSVADPACAVMLEKAIPVNRLMGFIVENDEDATFLKKLRDQQNWRMDIFTMKRADVDPRRHHSPAQLAALGLTGYLSDQIECPDIVRAFFYQFNSLDRVLWGRGADTLSLEQQRSLCQTEGGFRVYIHEVAPGRQQAQPQKGMTITEYRGTVSRNKSLPPSVSSIGIGPKNYLMSQEGDQDVAQRRNEIQLQIKQSEADLRASEQALEALKGRLRELVGKLQDATTERQELQKAARNPEHIKQKIVTKRKALEEVELQLSVNAGKEKQEKLGMYQAAIDKLLTAVRTTAEVAQKLCARKVDKEVAAALQDELADAIQTTAMELQEAKLQVKDLTKELKQAERDYDAAAKAKDEKNDELRGEIDKTGLSPQEYANTVWVGIRLRCPEATSAEVRERMKELNTQINSIEDNPQLQARYDQVLKEVAQNESDLKKATEEFEHAEEALTGRARRWLDMVRKTTAKLDVKFRAFMQDLQLGGEVKLKEIGKYSDFELQLRVSFREGSELDELSGKKHSGGERAVSTVMFLMALQDMTTSPFRVVDEINQGMDEANERLVFDRVVKSCCGDASKPQYFLVTPKLLQGLGAMRNDDVTVLLVWNGPGTGTKWVFSDLLERLSQGADGVARTVSPDQRQQQPASASAPAGVKVKPEPQQQPAGKRGRVRDPLDSDAETSDASEAIKAAPTGGARGRVAVKKQKV